MAATAPPDEPQPAQQPTGADRAPGEGPTLLADVAVVQGQLERQGPPVVGIGASAGGLEALTELFQAMPADSGLVFVVVSHLDPEHKSALGEILARVTAMPVREVENGLVIEPNHVYVMPPNTEMVLARSAFRLTRRATSRGPHTPVDTFLCSLA